MFYGQHLHNIKFPRQENKQCVIYYNSRSHLSFPEEILDMFITKFVRLWSIVSYQLHQINMNLQYHDIFYALVIFVFNLKAFQRDFCFNLDLQLWNFLSWQITFNSISLPDTYIQAFLFDMNRLTKKEIIFDLK